MRKISLTVLAIALIISAQSAFASSGASMARLEQLFLDGKYDAVISESGALISSGGSGKDELYYIKGLSELKGGRFAASRESFNRIIDRYPRSGKAFDARLGIGDAYFLEGNTAKALTIYSDMAGQYSADENIATVYGRLSLCYSKMGMRDKAESYLNMVRDKAPYSFEARSAPSGAAMGASRPVLNEPAPSGAREGAYSVQVGSFRNKRNAEKLAGKLSAEGYRSYISIPVASSDKFYRVRVGSLSSQADASNLASRLKSDGYRTKFCTDDVCE